MKQAGLFTEPAFKGPALLLWRIALRIVAWLATAAVFLPAMLTAMPSAASQIPLGIAFRHNIAIQETWHADMPFFCISNGFAQERVLRVARWRSRQLPALELLRWRLPASETRCFEAGSLRSEWLLEFSLLDGQRLGLLKAPGRPPFRSGNPAAYTSYLGANGSCPTPGIWTEQTDLWFAAGESGHVTMHTVVGADGLLMAFPVDAKTPLPQLRVTSVSSASLAVQQGGGQIAISGDGSADPFVHQARIEFEVPQVTQATMFLLSGRKRIASDGWQCFIRGVMVKPACEQ